MGLPCDEGHSCDYIPRVPGGIMIGLFNLLGYANTKLGECVDEINERKNLDSLGFGLMIQVSDSLGFAINIGHQG
jgi:hypothetical protein